MGGIILGNLSDKNFTGLQSFIFQGSIWVNIFLKKIPILIDYFDKNLYIQCTRIYWWNEYKTIIMYK